MGGAEEVVDLLVVEVPVGVGVGDFIGVGVGVGVGIALVVVIEVEVVVVVVQPQFPSQAPGTPPDSQYAPASMFTCLQAVHPPWLE